MSYRTARKTPSTTVRINPPSCPWATTAHGTCASSSSHRSDPGPADLQVKHGGNSLIPRPHTFQTGPGNEAMEGSDNKCIAGADYNSITKQESIKHFPELSDGLSYSTSQKARGNAITHPQSHLM